LVEAFTTAPVLQHIDYDREVIIETDASDYVPAGVLSQHDDQGVLHLVAYILKKHSPAECNYDIYNKELMAIINALEEWRLECEGAAYPHQLITDHKNLEYCMTKKHLNRRQVRWSEFLTMFDYQIVYSLSKSNGKADALTRRLGDHPEGGDERLDNLEQMVLKLQNLPEQLRLLADSPPAQGHPSISNLMTEAYETYPLPGKVLEAIRTKSGLQEVTTAECIKNGGRIRYRGNLYVPDSDELHLRIIPEHHDTALAGHPGWAKIFDLLDREYHWKEMGKHVDRDVWNCHDCQWSRSSRHATFGVLRPLLVRMRPGDGISMDCVVELPECDGFDAIRVEVDRLSKMRHYIPCHTTIDALGSAELFLREVVRLHGLPLTIISDWGLQFASAFWQQMCNQLGID